MQAAAEVAPRIVCLCPGGGPLVRHGPPVSKRLNGLWHLQAISVGPSRPLMVVLIVPAVAVKRETRQDFLRLVARELCPQNASSSQSLVLALPARLERSWRQRKVEPNPTIVGVTGHRDIDPKILLKKEG
jgi:hypothetical protein